MSELAARPKPRLSVAAGRLFHAIVAAVAAMGRTHLAAERAWQGRGWGPAAGERFGLALAGAAETALGGVPPADPAAAELVLAGLVHRVLLPDAAGALRPAWRLTVGGLWAVLGGDPARAGRA